MPTQEEERKSIGNIYPSGWKSVKYEGIVENNYLYNRCHLIGWQLAGENANKENLITGTRYMNVEGMLPFENMVDDYLEEDANKNTSYFHPYQSLILHYTSFSKPYQAPMHLLNPNLNHLQKELRYHQ